MCNHRGKTPLHLAAQLNNVNCGNTLLDAGAYIDAKDNVSHVYTCVYVHPSRPFTIMYYWIIVIYNYCWLDNFTVYMYILVGWSLSVGTGHFESWDGIHWTYEKKRSHCKHPKWEGRVSPHPLDHTHSYTPTCTCIYMHNYWITITTITLHNYTHTVHVQCSVQVFS